MRDRIYETHDLWPLIKGTGQSLKPIQNIKRRSPKFSAKTYCSYFAAIVGNVQKPLEMPRPYLAAPYEGSSDQCVEYVRVLLLVLVLRVGVACTQGSTPSR